MKFLTSVKNHPIGWGVGIGAGALGVAGAVHGGRTFDEDEQAGFHVKRAAGTAVSFATTGALALGTGYAFRKPLSRVAGMAMRHTGAGFKSEYKSFRAGKGFFRSFGTTSNLAGAGAILGGALGAYFDKDDQIGGAVKGAAIGAVAGVGVRTATQIAGAYKSMAATPVLGKIGKVGVLAGLAATAYGIGNGMNEPKPQAVAEPSDSGYVEEYGDPSSHQQRLQAVGATGDIVLGAHRGRHG